MNEKQKEDASRLCLACGLCCDGTLIGFVELNPTELPALKEVMDFEEEQGNGFFLQPCKKFCNGCTVYEDRPSQCASFQCGLLKSLEEKRLDFYLASIHIQSVIEKRAAINAWIKNLPIHLQSPSFYFQMVELKKLLVKMQHTASFTENHDTLLNELLALDKIVVNEFGISFSGYDALS